MRRAIVLVSIAVSVALLAYATSVAGALGNLGLETRALAKMFLTLAYNPGLRELTAMSPEAVTAIVWDFRGVDTLYETVVFYMAITAALAIYRGAPKVGGGGVGLSLIVRVVTRLLIPINIAVAVSIAVHGHLTPGGGFQAGVALAVISVLLAVVYSAKSFGKVGVDESKVIALESAGFVAIAAVVFAPLIYSSVTGAQAYLMQNYVKANSEFSFPVEVLGQLISGTLIWFNVAEFLAVSFSFFIIFMLLSLREEVVRPALVGEESGS